MDHWSRLARATTLHGFRSFSAANVQGAELAALEPALSATQVKLAEMGTASNWDAIATQFQAMTPAVSTIAIKQEDANLYLVLGRVPDAADPGPEHDFIEACAQWLKAIVERARQFKLSPDAQQWANQAVAAVGVNPLLAAGISLALSVSEFSGLCRALVVDVVQSESDPSTWEGADLTVDSGNVWTQIWLWQLDTGKVTRGGGRGWDTPSTFFVPGFDNPGIIERTLKTG